MSESRQIAIYGGSFNPPHVCHGLVVAYVLSALPIDLVLITPTYHHPFNKDLLPFDQRLFMCREAFAIFGEHVQISDVERQLGGVSRTLYTIEHLQQQRPDATLHLVIGSDVLPDLDNWYRFDRIAAIARIIVLGREGYPLPQSDPPVPILPDISSTEIRRRVSAGEPVAGLVTPSVARHIAQEGLYLERRP